jgi:hypothetical protein
MTETTTQVTPDTPHPGLLSRMIGVIFSPRDTYAAVAARPTWLGVMVITLVVSAASTYVMMSSPDMQDAAFDQALSNIQGDPTDQQVARIETFISYMAPLYAAVTLIFGPVFTAAMAGLLLWIFSMLMGGSGTFRQVFAMVTHSGVISMLSGVFTAALLAAGVPPTGAQSPSANLGVFVPMLDEMSFVVMFLSAFNLILIWWLVSLAIGLGVLYKRRTGPIATTFMSLYVVIALIIAVVRS